MSLKISLLNQYFFVNLYQFCQGIWDKGYRKLKPANTLLVFVCSKVQNKDHLDDSEGAAFSTQASHLSSISGTYREGQRGASPLIVLSLSLACCSMATPNYTVSHTGTFTSTPNYTICYTDSFTSTEILRCDCHTPI